MLAYSCLRGPPRLLVFLRWPSRPLSRLHSSLRLRVGLRLPPPTRLCLLRTCTTPAWLHSPPRFRPMPDGPPLAFSPNYRTLSIYLFFCLSLRFRLTLLLIVGPPLVLPIVVGQPRTFTLFLIPRLARTLLRWPQLALLLLRIHLLALGFLLQLRSLVRCRSLREPQPVALRSLNVRRSDLPPFLIVFPLGFRLSMPGCMLGLRLYIAVRRLYRLFCPVRGDAVRSPLPRCHGFRVYVLHGEGCGLLLPLFFFFFFFFFYEWEHRTGTMCHSLFCIPQEMEKSKTSL